VPPVESIQVNDSTEEQVSIQAHPTLKRIRPMKNPLKMALLAALATLGDPGPTLAEAATLHVFAAASLSDALRAIAQAYEKQSGDRLVFNFGASSLLARQIEEGAPRTFSFRDTLKMDALEKRDWF
jgi:molybdate transport system substrate-binding protein